MCDDSPALVVIVAFKTCLCLFQFMSSSNKLAEKVRLSLKYEEAKRR